MTMMTDQLEPIGYFRLYINRAPLLRRLTDEQRGQVLMALIDYAETGRLQQLDGGADLVLQAMSVDVDSARRVARMQRERYEARHRLG